MRSSPASFTAATTITIAKTTAIVITIAIATANIRASA
eukprot:CAMPEP_0119542304 /NCGR_PEP_ID=MMETSP1344-20130328/53503_1 /TAXON_ID=236787 /ORGANISM="Florenciella parvula, Strain CCMP2471" /LENGTH=37 /DNA_ID= /DNA_START= /DNA_END= /DNA_ORIENTATION=